MPRTPSIPTIPTTGAEDIGVAVPAGPSVVFLRDTFTGSNGTSIVSHTGELGATWTKHAQSTSVTQDQIQANRAQGPAATSTNIYTSSATPASPDYDVTIVPVVLVDNATSYAAPAGRMDTVANTCYFCQYYMGTDAVSLNVISAGVVTQLGSDVVITPQATLTLRMLGDQISCLVDGATVLGPFTNAVITTAGKAGYRHGGTNSTTDGVHIDSIVAAGR